MMIKTDDKKVSPFLAREGQKLCTHLQETATLAAEFAHPYVCGDIAYACGLLHDVGKYTPEFQQYLTSALKGEDVTKGEIKHAWHGAWVLFNYLSDDNSIAWATDSLANIIASHHTGLSDMLHNANRIVPERSKRHGKDLQKSLDILTLPEIQKLLSQINWNQITQNLKVLFKKCSDNFDRHLFVKLIYSCIVDADRCNAANKEFSATPNWGIAQTLLNKRLEKFKNVTPLDNIRLSISNQCFDKGSRERGIFSLSVPTGGGKTLASLRFAIEHAKRNNLSRIVYVIPYLSILDQIASEFKNIFKNESDEWILEHHSNFQIDDLNENATYHYQQSTSRWDMPIVLTTMVQFLESIYSNKASDLRKFHNMGNTLFIFDEVQALPVKCIYLYNRAINFLHKYCWSSFVLCTATQPHLDKVEQNIVFSEQPSLVYLKPNEQKVFERTKISDLTQSPMSYEQIADFIIKQANLGYNTLVILNTKREAKNIYSLLQAENIKKTFLSTDMCPAHRLDVLAMIKKYLQTQSQNNTPPLVCISTQLIEAGVDLSFNCVIRAEAGLDSIIQAAGRCNRNGESKEKSPVYVIDIENEEKLLRNLPEIEVAKRATARVLREGHYENLLDDQIMDRFYTYYFYERQKEMSYPINKTETLFSLLGKNSYAREAYNSAHPDENYRGIPCAFQSAAEKFSVIDGTHRGVVVPYVSTDKNKPLVQDLITQFQEARRQYDWTTASRILRQLQQYTITVYANRENEISNIAAQIEDSFYLLSADYYDPTIGLIDLTNLLYI